MDVGVSEPLLEVLADLNIKYNSDANESRIYYMPIKANYNSTKDFF